MTTGPARWHMTTRSTRGVVSRARASVTIDGRSQSRDFRGLTVRHALHRAERWILGRVADAASRPVALL